MINFMKGIHFLLFLMSSLSIEVDIVYHSRTKSNSLICTFLKNDLIGMEGQVRAT
jgi:hypothetical protein